MKKGFTLIELLAVIVILAVIALIATPMILNVIETSKVGAAESSALGYVEAIEDKVMLDTVKGISTSDGIYSVGDKEVQIKGNAPSEGWYKIEKGQVVDYSFKINEYVVNYDANKKGATATKDEVREVTYNIGEEITLGTEHFYVISSDNTTVTALAKYNLEVGRKIKYDKDENGKSVTVYNELIENPSGLQNSQMTGGVNPKCAIDVELQSVVCPGNEESDNYPINGVVAFDVNRGVDYATSTIKNYVDDYQAKLNLMGYTVNEARLLTKQEYDTISAYYGYNYQPAWLHSTSYWLQTAYANSDNCSDCVFNVGYTQGGSTASIDDHLGVRPVIVISKEALN